MSLLTLAEYKTLTNTTDGTYDAYITSLLPVVQSQVEEYCDRHFDKDIYNQWFFVDGELPWITLPEYPVTDLLFTGVPRNVATLTITGNYNVEVKGDSVTVTNLLNYNQDTYTFDSQPTLADLKTEIEDDYGPQISVSLVSGYETTLSKFLKQGNNLDWYAAVTEDIAIRLMDRSDRTVLVPYYSYTYCFVDPYAYYGNILLIWQAGYLTADVPQDLKMICAMIIKDYISLAKNANLGLFKSESITNYSYTLGDIKEIKNILGNYSLQLEAYRKKNI